MEIPNLEKIIIENCLLYPELIDIVSGILTKNDFIIDKHRIIFSEILQIKQREPQIDSGMLLLELQKINKDIVNYIPDLKDATIFGVSQIEYYAKRLKKESLLRSLKSNIIKNIESIEDFDEFTEKLSSLLDNALSLAPVEKERTIEDVAAEIIEDLEKKWKGEEDNIKIGIDKFDIQFGGIKPGRLYIVGARPGFGKTSLLMNIAYNVAKENNKVMFFTLEMSQYEIIKRLISHVGLIENKKFENPYFITEDDFQRIVDTVNSLVKLPLVIIDNCYMINTIKARVIKERPKLVIIDYVQLLKFTQKQLDRLSLALSMTARELKILAKEYNCAIFLASQLSREVEKRAEKEPMLSDYKESGGLEENADMATFLWWPARVLKENPKTKEPWTEEEQKKISWIIAKNRHGRIGTITLDFEAEYFKFVNL